jgi:hypothetical protein
MAVPKDVVRLVERFREHRDEYLSPEYNEATLRREFLEPLFQAMGWDVDNTKNYAEAYKEVIHEDALKVSGATKAPDYAFRLGGVRRFFVEAKKPSVDVKGDPSPAYQLRRYAWSAKLPLSILTDFHEFAVYDCTKKPNPTDTAATGRILYLTYEDYAERWGEIASLFSPEAIQKGAFDQFAASAKGKKGTAAVDDAFLDDIEAWRDLLAHNLALRNPELSQRELNDAVQTTIDRIIFLRICEDRGIENYGALQGLLNGPRVYPRLVELFRAADDRYNSGLFHFRVEKDRPGSPDTLTLSLEIDDKVLKEILGSLYYPKSPYEFSVLPADLLGHVYEQFLGKVIRLTAGHRAVVEDKPEVKKAGGVYYTPTYIVDYIVKNTVGKLVEGKSPKEVATLHVLDPACGSGSFLLGAYQCLLDWHRDWYAKNDPEKWAKGRSPKLFRGPKGDWRLTTAERKRILLDHLHGVDIDPQAVEVTKLSLLLKVLEGENAETLGKTLKLLHERALPDLGRNIQCGNSLIGPDFYADQPISLLDEEERYRTNAFDWETAFPEIMKKGGFDAVIGNPPYGVVLNETLQGYLVRKYKASEGHIDNYGLFIQRGLDLSLEKGKLGFIVPSTLLTNLSSRGLRRRLLDATAIEEITNFGVDVFADPTVHTCVLVASRRAPQGHSVSVRKRVLSPAELDLPYDYAVPQEDLGRNKPQVFDVFADPAASKLARHLSEGSSQLGDVCYIRQCIKTGNDKEYVRAFESDPGAPWKPTLRGRSIGRYVTLEKEAYVKYGPWLARNWKNTSFYETPKLAMRETGNRIIATLDLEQRYFLSSLYAVYPRPARDPIHLLFLLGIMNSLVATWFAKLVALNLTQGAFTKLRTNQLARLPIHLIDPSSVHETRLQEKLIGLVERMLALHGEATGTDHEKVVLQRQIDATDREIDELVFELYGLTDKEIKLVEEA